MDDGETNGDIRKHLEGMIKSKHDNEILEAEEKVHGSGQHIKVPRQAGLCVSIYKAGYARRGYPGYDRIYFLGFGSSIAQLGIAAIPCGVFGDWGILLVTVSGILLSFATGSISQWSKEKWACREQPSEKTVILTRGNGSQHAIVVIGNGKGLDLEDLAAGPTNLDVSASRSTRIAITFLAALWILLLITAAGIKENTWFLLAIGGLGILQNIYVAGRARAPEAFGIPLQFCEVIGEPKVMDTLFAVEEAYPRLGKSMLATFFPGELRKEEVVRWEELGNEVDALAATCKEAEKKAKA